jgi:hypothetical protein
MGGEQSFRSEFAQYRTMLGPIGNPEELLMASVLDRWQEHPDVEIIWNKITESHPGPPPQAFIGWVLDTRTWRRAIASPSKAAAMLSTTTKRGRCWYLRLLARDEERGAAFDRQAAENLPPRAFAAASSNLPAFQSLFEIARTLATTFGDFFTTSWARSQMAAQDRPQARRRNSAPGPRQCEV